jgi:hypothetical protein
MPVQTSVATIPNASAPGRVQRAYKTPVSLSRVCDESAGIPFGVLVVRDGSDRKVDLPTSAAEVQGALAGFAVEDRTLAYNSAGYANGDGLAVVYEGVIDALSEEAVTQGDPVYVRFAANGGNTQLGAVRNDSDGGTCALRPGAVFIETTTAAGFARLHQAAFGSGGSVYALTARLADVSTASIARVVVPTAGRVVAIYSVLGGAITGADSIVTCRIGTTAITGGALTVAFTASAAGDVDSAFPTALNVVAPGQYLAADTDGGSTGTQTLDVTFLIQAG